MASGLLALPSSFLMRATVAASKPSIFAEHVRAGEAGSALMIFGLHGRMTIDAHGMESECATFNRWSSVSWSMRRFPSIAMAMSATLRRFLAVDGYCHWRPRRR